MRLGACTQMYTLVGKDVADMRSESQGAHGIRSEAHRSGKGVQAVGKGVQAVGKGVQAVGKGIHREVHTGSPEQVDSIRHASRAEDGCGGPPLLGAVLGSSPARRSKRLAGYHGLEEIA